MQTLLITGAAGLVGTALRPYLRQHYRLRLLDRSPIQQLTANETAHTGDITDPAFVDQALEGCDAVLHLACAHGTGIAFEATVTPNYHATLYLLDAAQRQGVKRFVFTSSHHVLGQYRTDAAQSFDDMPAAPDSYYALSKAFGEAACAAWSHRYGLASWVIRIGNADAQVSDARRLRLWTSARDLAQLVRIGLEHPNVKYEVVYGVSECPGALFTNARARALGYQPQDNAAEHLAPGFLTYDAMAADTSGRDYLGGAYAAAPWAPLVERGA